METLFSVPVKSSPDQFVSDYDENTHNRNAGDDHGGIPFLRNLRDIGAETICLQGSFSPSSKFSHNTGIPCAAGCGTSAGNPERKNGGQNQRAPERPALQSIGPGR